MCILNGCFERALALPADDGLHITDRLIRVSLSKDLYPPFHSQNKHECTPDLDKCSFHNSASDLTISPDHCISLLGAGFDLSWWTFSIKSGEASNCLKLLSDMQVSL